MRRIERRTRIGSNGIPDQLEYVKRKGLEDGLAALREEYAAVNDQISRTWSEADILKLQRQLKMLELEIAKLEQELAGIVESLPIA